MTAGNSIVIRTAGAVWNVTESDGTESDGTESEAVLLDAGGRTYTVRRDGVVPTRMSSRELLALLNEVEQHV